MKRCPGSSLPPVRNSLTMLHYEPLLAGRVVGTCTKCGRQIATYHDRAGTRVLEIHQG